MKTAATIAAALALACAMSTASAYGGYLQNQWVGTTGLRVCQYSDGSVINVGFSMCAYNNGPPIVVQQAPSQSLDASIPLAGRVPHIVTPMELEQLRAMRLQNELLQQQLRRQ